jgi:hypothetical protein
MSSFRLFNFLAQRATGDQLSVSRLRAVGFWERRRKKREGNGDSCQQENRITWSGFQANASSSIAVTTASSAPCSGVRPVRFGKCKNTASFRVSLRAEGGACIFAETSAGTVTACRPKKTL